MSADKATAEQAGGRAEAERALAFHDGEIRTEINLRVYRLSAVQKAAYRLADRVTVILGTPVTDRLPLTFAYPARVTEKEAVDTARSFFQELLDQELREQIGEETRPLRSLILAHAFSKTDLIRGD